MPRHIAPVSENLRCTLGPDDEVILVDDGSRGATAHSCVCRRAARRRGDGCDWCRRGDGWIRHGGAAGHRRREPGLRGAARAQRAGRRGWLDKLVGHLVRDPRWRALPALAGRGDSAGHSMRRRPAIHRRVRRCWRSWSPRARGRCAWRRAGAWSRRARSWRSSRRCPNCWPASRRAALRLPGARRAAAIRGQRRFGAPPQPAGRRPTARTARATSKGRARLRATALVSIVDPGPRQPHAHARLHRFDYAHTPGALELVLVDNGSAEDVAGTARELSAAGRRVVYLRNQRNEGFAFGCNQGHRSVAW